MDPFVGEIKLVAFDYAPWGYAFCDGQIMRLTQNPALFALIGGTFGGAPPTTFALPNLQGRLLAGQGQANGRAFKVGESDVIHSAEPADTLDENSYGAVGLNFCIALQGIFPRRQ